jgi:iron(III) transport system ATP-binding protein
MNEGKIEQIGPPIEIYRKPKTRFVADFIGRANFVESTVRDAVNGQLVVDALGTTMTVAAPDGGPRVGQSATLVVRPEMVEIDHPEAQMEGIVRVVNYLGNVVEYHVDVGGQLLALVESDPRHTTIHPEGDSVRLRFLEDCLYVLPE